MCTYIYTTTFQRSDNDRTCPSWSAGFCLKVGTLVDVHVSQNQLCVVVLKFVRVQKKNSKKNFKMSKKKEKTLKELFGFSQ